MREKSGKILFFFFLLFFLFSKKVLADGVNLGDFKWAQSFQSLAGFVSFLFPRAILLAGIILFVMVVLGGVSMIFSAGREEAQQKEKLNHLLTYSLLGILFIFGAYWILQIINFLTKGALKDLLP